MVRLALPMVMVGVLVALAAKVMLVLPPPGIRALTDSMSLVLELESKGERESILWLALGGGAGRMPKAPGTCGSLLGLLWMAVLYLIPSFGWTLGVIGISLLAGVWVCSQAEKILKLRDPGCIVLDEILAVPIAGLGWMLGCRQSSAVIFSAENCGWLLEMPAIFVLFRFFDIAKPWPVNVAQNLPKGWGVMADDILAAIYAGLLLFLLFQLLPG